MHTGWRWWLPDEPGSTELIGGWKTHQHSTNAWEHLWQTTFTPSREWWGVWCIQSGGYKSHQDELSHYHRLHEQVLDFMAEDFHQKWNQMHHTVDVENGLTKVGTVSNHSSDFVTILGVQASSRKDHPAWFADLSTNARTKEEFMNKNCQVSDLYHIDDHNDGFPVCFISYWSQKISHQITYRPELGATWQRQNLSWKRKLSVKIRSSWYRTWLVTRDLTELTNSSFRFKTSKAD